MRRSQAGAPGVAVRSPPSGGGNAVPGPHAPHMAGAGRLEARRARAHGITGVCGEPGCTRPACAPVVVGGRQVAVRCAICDHSVGTFPDAPL